MCAIRSTASVAISSVRLKQSKTKERVMVRVGTPLKAMLDATKKRSTLILVNSERKPWTSDGFRSSWRKACADAGIVGLTFNDLRGTAVTRLAIQGATVGNRKHHRTFT
jgi:Phage integrase family